MVRGIHLGRKIGSRRTRKTRAHAMHPYRRFTVSPFYRIPVFHFPFWRITAFPDIQLLVPNYCSSCLRLFAPGLWGGGCSLPAPGFWARPFLTFDQPHPASRSVYPALPTSPGPSRSVIMSMHIVSHAFPSDLLFDLFNHADSPHHG
jgi:hypothetical protein